MTPKEKPKYHVMITDNLTGSLIENCDVSSLYVALTVTDGVRKKISLGERSASFELAKKSTIRGEF